MTPLCLECGPCHPKGIRSALATRQILSVTLCCKPYSVGFILSLVSLFLSSLSPCGCERVSFGLPPSPEADRGRMTVRDQPKHTSASSPASLTETAPTRATPRRLIGRAAGTRVLTPPTNPLNHTQEQYSHHAPEEDTNDQMEIFFFSQHDLFSTNRCILALDSYVEIYCGALE